MAEDVRVESWADLNERLFEGSWSEELGRFRSDFAFRGHADAAHALDTSLLRVGGDAPTLERHLLRNFRKYARRDAVPVDSEWDWLALAKHHHLPTRVLDWSYSPYVALHFATDVMEEVEADGAVWAVDYVRAHEDLPDRLREVLADEGSNVFTGEMLARVAENLGALDELASDAFSSSSNRLHSTTGS